MLNLKKFKSIFKKSKNMTNAISLQRHAKQSFAKNFVELEKFEMTDVLETIGHQNKILNALDKLSPNIYGLL
jgi:hypothetical protein